MRDISTQFHTHEEDFGPKSKTMFSTTSISIRPNDIIHNPQTSLSKVFYGTTFHQRNSPFEKLDKKNERLLADHFYSPMSFKLFLPTQNLRESSSF